MIETRQKRGPLPLVEAIAELGVPRVSSRLIKADGNKPFDALSDDPERRIVLLADHDGTLELKGLDGFEIALRVGWAEDRIERLVREKKRFALLLIPEQDAIPLDWDSLPAIVAKAWPEFPELAGEVAGRIPELRSLSFEAIDAMDGRRLSRNGRVAGIAEIDLLGRDHPEFQTAERFLSSQRSLRACRAFLYSSMHLRELFSGDGRTRDASGKPGPRELAIENRSLDEFPVRKLIDAPVIAPNRQGAAP
jgi:hypothetical protein